MTVARQDMFSQLGRLGTAYCTERLASVVRAGGPDECWNSTLEPLRTGYVRVRFSGYRWLAHRVAWALANKRDPGVLLVCHRCDNRRCCNPQHLFLGTALDNHADMAAKGRRAKQQSAKRWTRGPKLTEVDAAQIRNDPRLARIVAAEYGVSTAHVYQIRSGECWTAEGRAKRFGRSNLHPEMLGGLAATREKLRGEGSVLHGQRPGFAQGHIAHDKGAK